MLNKSFGFKHCTALHFEIATPVCALARNDTALGFFFLATGAKIRSPAFEECHCPSGQSTRKIGICPWGISRAQQGGIAVFCNTPLYFHCTQVRS